MRVVITVYGIQALYRRVNKCWMILYVNPKFYFSATQTAPAQAIATGVTVSDVLYTKCYVLFILLLDMSLIIHK